MPRQPMEINVRIHLRPMMPTRRRRIGRKEARFMKFLEEAARLSSPPNIEHVVDGLIELALIRHGASVCEIPYAYELLSSYVNMRTI